MWFLFFLSLQRWRGATSAPDDASRAEKPGEVRPPGRRRLASGRMVESLENRRRPVAERRVEATGVVEALDEAEDLRACASATVRNRSAGRCSSHSSVAKKLSHIALSYASPTEPIDCTTPASRHRFPKASDVYCEPLVAVMDRPDPPAGGGRIAIVQRVALTRSARIRRAIAQPTIRRLHASSTTARYSHPASCAHLRDVGQPQLVGPPGREVAVHQIPRGPGVWRPASSCPSGSACASRPRCPAPPSGAPPACGPSARPPARSAAWIRGRAVDALRLSIQIARIRALEFRVAPRPRRGSGAAASRCTRWGRDPAPGT